MSHPTSPYGKSKWDRMRARLFLELSKITPQWWRWWLLKRAARYGGFVFSYNGEIVLP